MIIRRWCTDDIMQLVPMIRESLEVGIERGGDMLPTDHNVGFLLNLGLAQAKDGQPTLCATDGAVVLGYVIWGWVTVPLDVRWRTCLAGNSYVRPEWRHQGVAGQLREVAKRMCREAGIERIMGPVHVTNQKGMMEFMRQGAWPTTVQMELML